MSLKYRRIIVISCIACSLLCLNHFADAQTNIPAPQNTPVARKIDEFGDILYSDLIARLDNLAIELQNEPNARGFLIAYRTRRDLPGLSNRLALGMRSYLVNERGISAERIIAVDGGVASCLTRELWIAPVGTAPTPRSDAYSNEITNTVSARKFDEFYFSLPHDDIEADAPRRETGHPVDLLESFVTALRRQPRAQAYVIAYAQYDSYDWDEYFPNGQVRRTRRRTRLDPPGTAQMMLRTERNHLIRTFGIAPSRIRLVNGGYRRSRQIELWIVPRGEHAPIPTPNAFPRRRNNRRAAS